MSAYRPVIAALLRLNVSRETFICPAVVGRRLGILERRVEVRVGTSLIPVTQPDGGTAISYISVLLAVVVGIAHAGLAPEIEIAGVRPNLMLVAVVLVTALLGFGPGIVWAFAGGLTANLISTTPLGSMPLSLLMVSALVAGGDRLFGRLTWLYPILAAFAGSMLADLVIVGVFRLLSDSVSTGVPVNLILPAAVLNAGLAGLLLYPARALTRRMVLEERPAW